MGKMISEQPSPNMVHEGFPVLQNLPQLRIASDASLMREVFGRHLQPSIGNSLRIEDCTITRIRRNLQTSRCILQYDLRLANSLTGREHIQWVTGVIYLKDRAEHIWQKLRLDDPEAAGTPQTLKPVAFIPELKMLVQLFPHDRRLPSLPLLINGPSAEMESLLLARFGRGNWQTEAWNVEPIRYRAGLAVVLRYTLQARDTATGGSEKRHFYVKIYRDEKGEHIYQLLQALWRRTKTSNEHFAVGRPVAYLRNLRALIQEEASGITLQQILLENQDQEVDLAVRKVARALASLHLDHVPTTRCHLLADEIAFLEKAKRTLQWASPHLEKEIETIVRTIVADLREVPLRPTHLDLKPDHILLDGDRYALLDFDSFAHSDPVLDAAHLLAQIFGLKVRLSATDNRLRKAASAFFQEYFNHVPLDWRSRLPSHYACAALKVALGFFRRQEPGWPDKISAMVVEAKKGLPGKVS